MNPVETIPHFYEKINGFFTFPDFYSWLAHELPPNSHVVEVGVWTGQSAAYLGVEMHNAGSKGRLDLVDINYAGSRVNVLTSLSPIMHIVGVAHQECSWEAASHYKDGSLDAVFIDADHSYESVRKDIDAWLPKVKIGGYIAGHDFTPVYEGVIRAVTETFDEWKVWRGIRHGGDSAMQGRFWPVWCHKKLAEASSLELAVKDPSTIYTKEWFEEHAQGIDEYRRVADVVHQTFDFKTVLDVGCGPGFAIHRLAELGHDVRGIDGSKNALTYSPIADRISIADITYENQVVEPRDIVICTEVAEHLEARHADTLVEFLTNAAETAIFFTAAPPGQGGHDHVNEQPPAYWIEKFIKRGWTLDENATTAARVGLQRVIQWQHWYTSNAMVFAPLGKFAPRPKKRNDLVSVVIPCKDQAHYLPEAVASIEAQTHQNIEVIFVTGDEASDEVAEQLRSKMRTPVAGIVKGAKKRRADAVNRGINIASGKYVMTLDADDRLDPTAIEKLLAATPVGVDLAITSCDLQYFGDIASTLDTVGYSHESILKGCYLLTCSLYTKKLWEAVGGLPVAMWGFEDWAFWIACSRLKPAVTRVPERLFFYRYHNERGSNFCEENRNVLEAMIHVLNPWAFPSSLDDAATIANAPEPVQERILAMADFFPEDKGARLLATIVA